jgi:hypothetical protein
MRTSLMLCTIGILVALSSCGSETSTPEVKRADAIEEFKLSAAQPDIMGAHFEATTKTSVEEKYTRR